MAIRLAWLLGIRNRELAEWEEDKLHEKRASQSEEEDECGDKESIVASALVEVTGNAREESPRSGGGERVVSSETMDVMLEGGDG